MSSAERAVAPYRITGNRTVRTIGDKKSRAIRRKRHGDRRNSGGLAVAHLTNGTVAQVDVECPDLLVAFSRNPNKARARGTTRV
jgi:hypothetical protein